MLMNEDELVMKQVQLIFELIWILVLLNVLHFDLINEVNLVMIDLIDKVNNVDIDEVLLQQQKKK
jgi:hypothetical protein